MRERERKNVPFSCATHKGHNPFGLALTLALFHGGSRWVPSSTVHFLPVLGRTSTSRQGSYATETVRACSLRLSYRVAPTSVGFSKPHAYVANGQRRGFITHLKPPSTPSETATLSWKFCYQLLYISIEAPAGVCTFYELPRRFPIKLLVDEINKWGTRLLHYLAHFP